MRLLRRKAEFVSPIPLQYPLHTGIAKPAQPVIQHHKPRAHHATGMLPNFPDFRPPPALFRSSALKSDTANTSAPSSIRPGHRPSLPAILLRFRSVTFSSVIFDMPGKGFPHRTHFLCCSSTRQIHSDSENHSETSHSDHTSSPSPQTPASAHTATATPPPTS